MNIGKVMNENYKSDSSPLKWVSSSLFILNWASSLYLFRTILFYINENGMKPFDMENNNNNNFVALFAFVCFFEL